MFSVILCNTYWGRAADRRKRAREIYIYTRGSGGIGAYTAGNRAHDNTSGALDIRVHKTARLFLYLAKL